MHDPVETFEVNGFTVEIHNDSDPANPRKEYDHVGTMVCDHRLYDLGDKKGSPEDIPDDAICLPLYLYDHGGITMSTSPFSCPWDSGQVGVIYCTKEKAIKEWGKKRFTKKVEERAIKYLIVTRHWPDEWARIAGIRISSTPCQWTVLDILSKTSGMIAFRIVAEVP